MDVLIWCYDSLQLWRSSSPSCYTVIRVTWPEIASIQWQVNVKLWRPRPLPQHGVQGHASFRAPRGICGGLHWDCITFQLLPLSSPASFPSFPQTLIQRALIKILHTISISVSASPGSHPATLQKTSPNGLVMPDIPPLYTSFLSDELSQSNLKLTELENHTDTVKLVGSSVKCPYLVFPRATALMRELMGLQADTSHFLCSHLLRGGGKSKKCVCLGNQRDDGEGGRFRKESPFILEY